MPIGTTELLLILGVGLLLFGASSIPKIAHSLGKAKTEFKKGMDEGEKDSENKDDGKRGM